MAAGAGPHPARLCRSGVPAPTIATFKPILALGNPDVEPEVAATFNVGAILDREGLFDFGGRPAVSDISAISVSVVNGPDPFTGPLILRRGRARFPPVSSD